jgi:hypothetical protein
LTTNNGSEYEEFTTRKFSSNAIEQAIALAEELNDEVDFLCSQKPDRPKRRQD